ncbi:type II toxin-antitoxin system MqsR family toxin [Herbaspirillum rubrisubalbicans]|uniref:type II toxin-antitoxin system MqsR family toxin n=1 Tax=Herbaspirillum rubrisubalbicans TaxID=80842 RepID=UPI00209D202D|nr:type II toxin-antitoxin system MqsR family toxin [Herbaspirillum rubrisubalbicans]MCP1572808.1 motility quorum-sensing regulator/GCU-specific mRNA interferase toxin [Herbaspirillum rubrisubalbicans]
MEKPTAHCKLAVVRALIEVGQVRATASAFQGARALGIEDMEGICSVILALTHHDFHKSMTTHADHRIWQDVYRPRLASGAMAYLKLSVIDDLLVVSFKEL